MSKRGHLIVLEGPDGVGKTKLAEGLIERLRERGISCHRHAFPGDEPGTLGFLVYRLHHDRATLKVDEIAPVALQAAHIAAHLDAIERVIRPKLNSGENIVLDRYWWSTAVYGAVNGSPRDVLESLIAAEERCWGVLRPLVIFLIDREKPWREGEDTPEWHQLAQKYRCLAAREQTRSCVEVVENSDRLEEVVAKMANRVVEIARSVQVVAPGEYCTGCPQDRLTPTGGKIPNSAAPTFSVARTKTLKPTKVFDTYWYFAVERQQIFFRRLENAQPPWTSDAILQRHRFTNAYRASDRVSQYLIRRVQYEGEQAADELFFRTVLFKLFNRIETWELLEQALGGLHSSEFKPSRYAKAIDEARKAKKRIYSAAYIMPVAAGGRGQAKHVGHLRLLEMMLREGLPGRLADARSFRHAFEMLRSYPMMGDFLGFQYLTDLNYSRLLNFSEMEFVVPGPGARRGIQKCFGDLNGVEAADVIRYVTEKQCEEFERCGLAFRDLWGRPLQLIDCQNLFCEVDKYARVAHPDVGISGDRTRIKQRFHARGRLPMPWYPPKWNLNERIGHNREVSNAFH